MSHPSAEARVQRIAEARRLLADGLSLEQAADRLGYVEVSSLRRALRQDTTTPAAPPSVRPPTLADDLAAVSAEAAALEADAQQALWRGERAAWTALMGQARKAYERKRVLWAARHPYVSERKARERSAA
jgi:hypothetical protein